MTNEKQEIITLGGGCFWCTEAIFTELRGVTHVVSGYAGGHVDNPTYRQVCSEATGHAEVVQVTFDPRQITIRELLEVFLTTHNPTTPNRQGADVGSQYRSIIFFHSLEQKQIVEQVIAEFNEKKIWAQPIVTEVKPLEAFYQAEPEHMQYYGRNPNQGYCQAVIEPKIVKMRNQYREKLKKTG